jgi:hypothetical protein
MNTGDIMCFYNTYELTMYTINLLIFIEINL